MAEYIDREKMLKQCEGTFCSLCCDDNGLPYYLHSPCKICGISLIKAAPAEDVVPVVHGYWIVDETKTVSRFCHCSICGQKKMLPLNSIFDYCSNCGSKMDLEVKNA